MTNEEEAGGLVCAGCGLANDTGAQFCAQCGSQLGVPRTVRRSRGEAATDAVERAHGRKQFGRIKKVVGIVRSVFGASAALAGVWLLAWHFGGTDVDEDLVVPVTVLLWSMFAITAAGALLVMRAPLPWTTVGACMWTLDAALRFAWFGTGGSTLLQAFFAVAFWFAVAQAARVQKLMAADPSLQLVRKRIDPSRRVAGGVSEHARKSAAADRRATWGARLRLVSFVVLGCVLLGGAYHVATRPPTVDAIGAALFANWAKSDVEAIAALFGDGPHGARATEFRDDVGRRGWTGALPTSSEPVTTSQGDTATATSKVAGGEIRFQFARSGNRWSIVRAVFPALVPTDLAPALEDFRRAWAAPGADELVAMFRPESRERLGGSLRRMLEKRSWNQKRPPLGEVATRDAGTRRRADFALGDDEVGVALEFWHPRWVVVGVTLPRQ